MQYVTEAKACVAMLGGVEALMALLKRVNRRYQASDSTKGDKRMTRRCQDVLNDVYCYYPDVYCYYPDVGGKPDCL